MAAAVSAPPVNGVPSWESENPEAYEGEGQGESPPSPKRGHRRIGSRSSRSSLKSSKSASSEKPVVYEQVNGIHGNSLTSVKPPDGYENETDEAHADRKGASRTDSLQLTSGRQPSAGWERSGIRFAPLNVPLKRRLQTLIVLLHTLSIVLTVSTFFFCCANPLMWILLLPYVTFILFSDVASDGSLKGRWEWLRRQKVWSLFASYFPVRLHRTTELPPTRKYLFGYHPHGIISHGAFAAFGTDALGFSQLFPGITNSLLTLESNFRIPFYRDYLLWMGLCSVSRASCMNILTKGGINGEGMGRAITIVIGGAQESLMQQPGTMRLVLKCRKGFVRVAVNAGADLVPVIAFGENDIYEQVDPREHPYVHKIQMLIKKTFGFTTPLFHARGVFNYDVGIMPYRRPLNIVVGRPVKVMKQEQPDQNYVNQLQQEYINELKLLWDTWKDDFAPHRVAEFEIVE